MIKIIRSLHSALGLTNHYIKKNLELRLFVAITEIVIVFFIKLSHNLFFMSANMLIHNVLANDVDDSFLKAYLLPF